MSTKWLAPFVPTPALCIKEAMKLLQIEKSTVFYDLGGGDGRVSFEALSQSSTSVVRCVENDDRLCNIIEKDFKKYCRMHRSFDQSRFELLRENMMDIDFSDATHIYMYLTQEGVSDITPSLNKYLQHGTRIVSLEYAVPNWSIITTEAVFGMNLYLYQIGMHKT